MQLTGKQIVEAGIIKNYDEENAIQQQGIDVRVARIAEVYGQGIVPAEGKTTACKTRDIGLMTVGEEKCWVLNPGYYELTLVESCNIPNNCELDYKTRSSLVRCGATIHSGQFDAGFNTDEMGCFMHVRMPIRIGYKARVAQAVVNETYPVSEENLYNGQWQGDKQRKTRKKKAAEPTEETTE